ncbi:MAG: hypothetical protein HGB05_02190 [Chloroflexi bacterium]|nr:hypothetical protein [Chloroflexota bacterium]
MSEPIELSDGKSLRQVVRDATGYDVRRCGRCSYCVHFVTPDDVKTVERGFGGHTALAGQWASTAALGLVWRDAKREK